MQNVSSLYRQLVKQSGRTFRVKIIAALSNGSQVIFTDDNIMQNSLKISSATSNEGSFDIGCAIINELSFDIDNSAKLFKQDDFINAVFDVRIGLVTAQKWDGTLQTEWLKKGLFTAEEINVKEKYTNFIAYDFMAKFDVDYEPTGNTLTLSEMLNRICDICGVENGILADFANSDFTVTDSIDIIGEGITCREMISYIAQITCSYAYIDTNGRFMLGWYNNTEGVLNERQKLSTPITISGVQTVDINDELYTLGNEGYVISIESNPLMQVSGYNPLSHPVFCERLINYTIIPFECDAISDPAIEAGDIITVSDLNGNTYRTPVTSVIFSLDSKMKISCDAETENEKRRAGGSPSSKILYIARNESKKQISLYNTFSQIAANAMGYFETLEIQDDGSTIAYMHDKPLLSESLTVWKKTADGIFISNDGGKTYSKGIDSDGNAAVKTVSAHGITVKDVESSFVTNIKPGVFQLKNGGTINLEANSEGINIFNGSLTIYKGTSTASEKVISLDNDGNVAFTGYLTQPGSFTKALVGDNIYGYPGFFLYRTDLDAYKKSDNSYQPYCEIWTSTSNETCLTVPGGFNIFVDKLKSGGGHLSYLTLLKDKFYVNLNNNSLFDLTTTAKTFYGDFDFTGSVNSENAFILYTSSVKIGSFYVSTTANPVINSDNGKDILVCVKNNTKIKVSSSGGNLYGTWYGTSNQAITSDRKLKHSIEPLSSLPQYTDVFDKLNPVRYKYNDGESGRFHTGFIAQDVETAVYESGLSGDDFAGFLKDIDGNYFLRYEELIALLVNEVKSLKQRCSVLEEIIKKEGD